MDECQINLETVAKINMVSIHSSSFSNTLPARDVPGKNASSPSETLYLLKCSMDRFSILFLDTKLAFFWIQYKFPAFSILSLINYIKFQIYQVFMYKGNTIK